MVARGDSRDPAVPVSDPEAEQLLDRVFPDAGVAGGSLSRRQLYAVIPEAVIQASPDQFATFLDAVFVDQGEVDRALDRDLEPVAAASRGGRQAVRAVVPADLLLAQAADPERFIGQVFEAFDEIEEVLRGLDDRRRDTAAPATGPTTAVVSEDVLADPEALLRAVDRVQSEAEKLELLLRQARHTLRRLQPYRLSRRSPGDLLGELRKADHVRSLQYLVDFLRSIQVAADSFEQLALPRPHIRDYLEHLYSLEDWGQMSDLVDRLRQAVSKYLRTHRQG